MRANPKKEPRRFILGVDSPDAWWTDRHQVWFCPDRHPELREGGYSSHACVVGVRRLLRMLRRLDRALPPGTLVHVVERLPRIRKEAFWRYRTREGFEDCSS